MEFNGGEQQSKYYCTFGVRGDENYLGHFANATTIPTSSTPRRL
jgi:hypothetical protein